MSFPCINAIYFQQETIKCKAKLIIYHVNEEHEVSASPYFNFYSFLKAQSLEFERMREGTRNGVCNLAKTYTGRLVL